MKINHYLLASCLCIISISCNKKNNETTSEDLVPATVALDTLARGKYLVDTNGCHDCHSPKRMTEKGLELIPDRILSGHPADEPLAPYDIETAKSYVLFTPGLTAAIGPWGTSFAANLTPDDTGIGTWTNDQFFTAIRKGLYKGLEGSRPLLPPMPWEHYANFTDEDLSCIFVYLKNLDPVENIVPAPIPPQA